MASKARQLPTVEIGGLLYYVDIRLEQFRPVDVSFPWNIISFDELFDSEDGGYEFLFDTSTRDVYKGPQFESAEHVTAPVIIQKLNNLRDLDPVYFENL